LKYRIFRLIFFIKRKANNEIEKKDFKLNIIMPNLFRAYVKKKELNKMINPVIKPTPTINIPCKITFSLDNFPRNIPNIKSTEKSSVNESIILRRTEINIL
jgi:hypothetical protein